MFPVGSFPLIAEYATNSDSPSNSQMLPQSLRKDSFEDGSEVLNTSVLNGSFVLNCTSVQCTRERNSTRTECNSSITLNLLEDPRNRRLIIFPLCDFVFYHLSSNSYAY